ncbi:MAG: CpXC domain-containing protein [Elusimicrobiales bacterium]|nr:CpXC domain-containing protein [Elusimicrobiales bacterium]
MSAEIYREVICPHCNYEFEAKFWTVVRGDIDIEIKDLILRGDFNTILCPNCDKIFFKEEDFIYFDPKYQLLVFVMPSYKKEKEKIINKLIKDYDEIKQNLDPNSNLNIEPSYLFSIDELKELLENDIDIEEETEVLNEICRIKKLKTLSLDKTLARKKNLPFSLPFTQNKNKDDVLETSLLILDENPNLKRLENLVKLIKELNNEIIEFINESNSFK